MLKEDRTIDEGHENRLWEANSIAQKSYSKTMKLHRQNDKGEDEIEGNITPIDLSPICGMG